VHHVEQRVGGRYDTGWLREDKRWGDEHIQPQPLDGNRVNHRLKGVESKLNSVLEDILATGAENLIVTHCYVHLAVSWMSIPVEHFGYCNLLSRPGCVTCSWKMTIMETVE